MCCLSACAPLRPNRASPCAERAGASVRTARQSEDCLRVRPPRSATALRKGRSASGGDAARGWHGRVGGSGTARHSATADSAFPAMRNPSANAPCMAWSIGRARSPCALQRRLAASCASRRRIRSGHVVSAAHPARAIRRMSAQALPLAPLDLRHPCASHHLGARAPTLREARRGGGDTRRSKRRRRDAQDAAIALARRDGRYSDQAPRCAGAAGLRALRRRRARQPAVRRRSASRSSALTECAGRKMPPP